MARPSAPQRSAYTEAFHKTLRARLQRVGIDAKRRPGTEAGMEAWYPYYAGYTEDFVAEVIEASKLGFGLPLLIGPRIVRHSPQRRSL